MSLFGNLKSDGLEESTDRLGGFQAWETGIYTGPIKVAYAGQSASGARYVTLIVDHDGKEYHETIYITNKAGENWFLNKETKKKVPLPGFTIIDDTCLVTTGAALSDQESEEKMVKVYDVDAKKELPKSVPVLTGLTGKIVSLAILKTLENKSVKDTNGVYNDTAETRFSNNIDKVFHTETKMTVAEARNGAESGTFWEAWDKKNKGVDRDKRTIKDGSAGVAGKPGAARIQAGPPQAGSGYPARKSLFNAK